MTTDVATSDARDTLPRPHEVVRRLLRGNEHTRASTSSPTTDGVAGNADLFNGNIYYSPGLNYCFKIAPGRSVWHVLPTTCGCSLSTCSSCQYEMCPRLSYDAGTYSKTSSSVQWFIGGSGDRSAKFSVTVDPRLTSPVWSITTPPHESACPTGHGPCYLISMRTPPLAPSPPPAPPVSELVEVHPISARLSTTYRIIDHSMGEHDMGDHSMAHEHDMSHGTPCVAAACIDGYEGVSNQHPDCDGTCHTDEIIGSSPWLEVDLGSVQAIAYVQIFNRPTCSTCQAWLGTDGPYELWVGDTSGQRTSLCTRATAPPSVGPFTTPCDATGRFITLLLPTSGGVKRILNIAEIRVFANGLPARPPPPSLELRRHAPAPGAPPPASPTHDVPRDDSLGGLSKEVGGLSKEALVAIVAGSSGGTVMLLLICLAVYFCWRRRQPATAARRTETKGLVALSASADAISSEPIEDATGGASQPAMNALSAALVKTMSPQG